MSEETKPLSELTEDEILSRDTDPLEDLAALRREEENASTDEEENSEESAEEEENSEEDSSEEEAAEEKNSVDEEDIEPEEEEEEKAESEEQKPVKRTFKADGQEYEFTEEEMLDKFGEFFGKAVNFTGKTQKLKPYTRMISALEENNIKEAEFNMALDLLKGDKDAILQLAKDKNIDLTELSFEEDDKKQYTPNNYGKSDNELKIQEIEDTIKVDPEYTTTADVINSQWDDESRQFIADNPDLILALHNDVKSGVFDKVAPEAAKLRVLDDNPKSNLEYYILAGQSLKNSQKPEDKPNKEAAEAKKKFAAESSKADKKRAASSTASVAGNKSVTDYLDDDDDEAYEAWRKNLDASI